MSQSPPIFKIITLARLMTGALISLPILAFAQDSIDGVGDLAGGSYFSEAYAVSGDGGTIVGYSISANGHEAFSWTDTAGIVGLGDLPGGIFDSEAYGVNGSGSVIVGSSTSANGTEAFRWTASGGMIGLGDLAGGTFFSYATAVNSDGSVVVGTGNSGGGGVGIEAFRWTASGGMVGLGFLPGGDTWSEAFAVSDDGNVVVGYADYDGFGSLEAFRWTQAGGMVGLGDLPGSVFESEAYGVNNDGSVVVGWGSGINGAEAFRWTQSGGMAGLGDLTGGTFSSRAYDVNSDGTIVVGWGTSAVGREAFRWTQSDGILSVKQWLTNNGVTVAPGVSLTEARSISNDGSVIVGFGDFGSGSEAFVARVGYIGSGAITLTEASESISSITSGMAVTLSTPVTLMNGAHSRPMSRKVAAGQKTMWLTGDWGHDNHHSRDGKLGLAEIGVGYNFGLMQVNASLGKTWAKQSLIQNGEVDAGGRYLMVEGIIPISDAHRLYATLGTYSHWGDADIRRGYLNAGSPDFSSASPDTHTWGIRTRLDWENAYSIKASQLSPYIDLSYSASEIDDYTETGGGFPAHFDERKEDITELRVGLNVAMPLPVDKVTFIANIELAHRFDDQAEGSSGELLGLFAFDLDGQNYKSTWLKGGIGLEGKVGRGKAYLMLNGTTEGEMPSGWLAASYQVAF